MDLMPSLQSLAKPDSSLSVYGLMCIELSLLLIDLAHSEFLLSLHSFLHLGSPLLVSGMSRLDLFLSPLDLVSPELSTFLRTSA